MLEKFRRDEYIFSTTSLMVDVGQESVKERQKQIQMLIDEISLYGIFVKDLVSHYPSYKYRTIILNIVYYMIKNINMYEKMLINKRLPINKIARNTKISAGFIENWQDYILTYFVIMSNSKYKSIQGALNIQEKEKSISIIPFTNKIEDMYRGIIVSVQKKDVIILTSEGEFVRIKSNENISSVGAVAHGKRKKGIKSYKFQISLGIIILMLLSFLAYADYNRTNSTVILKTTSQIKFEVNKGNKVIYTYSPTDKGTSMLNQINPIDKNIDEVLKESIEYASKNQMIPDNGLLITINGKALKYGILEQTGEYVVDNNISVEINNAGSLHNIYDFIAAKRNQNNKEEK